MLRLEPIVGEGSKGKVPGTNRGLTEAIGSEGEYPGTSGAATRRGVRGESPQGRGVDLVKERRVHARGKSYTLRHPMREIRGAYPTTYARGPGNRSSTEGEELERGHTQLGAPNCESPGSGPEG